MAQTKEGGSKIVATMIRKHGSYEAFVEHMKSIGRQGGRNGRTGGFASYKVGKDGLDGFQRASKYGRIGGLISRRTKKAQ